MSPRKTYILKLYVAGNTPNSMRALKTLRNILETEFRGVYALKVIDVLKIRNWPRKTRSWQRRRCPRFFPRRCAASSVTSPIASGC